MRISIVGGYDREFIQAFLAVILPKGGVTEVRVLKIGNADYINGVITMIKLVFDIDFISAVELDELLQKDGTAADVLLFLNSTYENIEEFTKKAFPLVKIIFENVKKSGIEDLKIVFGDNNRGLLQHAYFCNLMKEENLKSLQLVTLSSVYEISRSLNSAVESGSFRSFPKIDGEAYTYDPDGKMTQESAQALAEELREKIRLMEETFTGDRSASSHPFLEGVTLGRFVELLVQTNDWDLAKRESGLVGRIPSPVEKDFYQLDSFWPLFLPAVDGDDEKRLPEIVHTHLKQTSTMIQDKISGTSE